MAELTVEMTYGKALFYAAQEAGKTDLILEEATQIAELFQKEKEFFELFCTPTISAAKKKQVIKNVFEGRVTTELLHLLYILVDKGRGRQFSHIVQQYRLLIHQNMGFSIGTIFSVEPLSADQLAKFEEQTGKLLQKRVKLENHTDRTLIGGVRIFIGGKVIDASIKKRLTDLKETLQ